MQVLAFRSNHRQIDAQADSGLEVETLDSFECIFPQKRSHHRDAWLCPPGGTVLSFSFFHTQTLESVDAATTRATRSDDWKNAAPLTAVIEPPLPVNTSERISCTKILLIYEFEYINSISHPASRFSTL